MDINPDTSSVATKGGYVVRRPRATDAVGRTLRDVFEETPMPSDFYALLQMLDRVTH